MNRKELLETVQPIVQRFITTEREEVPATVFAVQEGREKLMYEKAQDYMQSAHSKRLFIEGIAEAIPKHSIVATCFVTEGWASSLSEEEYRETRRLNPDFSPSKDPERYEVLILVAEDPDGLTTRTFKIAQDRSTLELLSESDLDNDQIHALSTADGEGGGLPTRFVWFPNHVIHEPEPESFGLGPEEADELSRFMADSLGISHEQMREMTRQVLEDMGIDPEKIASMRVAVVHMHDDGNLVPVTPGSTEKRPLKA